MLGLLLFFNHLHQLQPIIDYVWLNLLVPSRWYGLACGETLATGMLFTVLNLAATRLSYLLGKLRWFVRSARVGVLPD